MNKDLKACVAALRAIQGRNDIDPEQREEVSLALARLKRLGRMHHPSKADVIRTVREVTEGLLRAFWRKR